jgi:beta-lactam-binding protein with PASTA domain
MNEGMAVLLWLVLLGALAVPLVWVAWVVFKRMKANEKTADNSPESSEETTK